MKKKSLKIVAIVLAIIFALGIIFMVQTKTNPRVRLLMSTFQFTEKTLKNPSYLFYEIDIMELFRNYFNAATEVEGDLAIYDVKKLGFSFTMETSCVRSFSQKKFASKSSASVFGIDAGTSEIYIEDDTIYTIMPTMDLAFAFPTGMELFQKMPDLTHDINREWFHDNVQNIIEFTGQIKIVESGDFIRDQNGERSDEFVITIPKGTGAFLWELLGMDMPEYDVVVSMFLNNKNQLRRMVIDLDKVMPGSRVEIDGTDVGTLTTYMELPDGERMHMTMVRLADKKNTMSFETVYDTNTDVHYNMEGSFSWTILDDGFQMKVKEMQILHGGETLAKINFNGSVKKLKEEPDVFASLDRDLKLIVRLDWKSIRDDVEGFTKDIIAKLKEVRMNK